MGDDPDRLAERYYLDLVAAFVRGKLEGVPPSLSAEETYRYGLDRGLRLHKFKRTMELPRVRRVLGLLRSLYPTELLDVGTGRGAFLWPLLDAFPDLPVTAVDVREDRVADLRAAAGGGLTRLRAEAGDVLRLPFPDAAFDGVTLLEVLEHTTDPARAAAEAVRVARRFVVVSVPSKPDDNPEHLHLFDRDRLTGLFAAAGAARVTVDHVPNHLVAVATVGRPANPG